MAHATLNTILDAAVSCFHRNSIDKVTMSDIIAESGLARTTVYRHFPTKDDIISQLVLRDIDSLVQQLDSIRSKCADDDFDKQLLEVLYFTILEIGERPLLAELFSQDPIRLNKLGLTNEAVAKYSQAAIRPTFEYIRSVGRIRDGVTVTDYSDWCRRIVMSFVGNPHPYQRKPAKMRLYIRSFIVPSLLADAR
jgi:AcrR family transcriptional regulator